MRYCELISQNASRSEGASGGGHRRPEQLEQVVGGSYQRPFPIHLLQAPQLEPIEASGALDLAKHWFNNGLAQGVDRLASLGSELAVHPTAGIKGFPQSAPRWPWPLTVMLPAGGDIGIDAALFAGFQVGGIAVTRICRQRCWQLAGVGVDSLQHGQQVHGVAGLVADADRHDHLVVAIDSGLDILPLDPTVSSLEDVAVKV